MSHAAPEHVMDWAEWELTKAKAATLAETMNGWSTDIYDTILHGDGVPTHPDLVEWCRSARDILEAVAHG